MVFIFPFLFTLFGMFLCCSIFIFLYFLYVIFILVSMAFSCQSTVAELAKASDKVTFDAEVHGSNPAVSKFIMSLCVDKFEADMKHCA